MEKEGVLGSKASLEAERQGPGQVCLELAEAGVWPDPRWGQKQGKGDG